MPGTELSKTRTVYLGLKDKIVSGAFALDGLPGEQTLAGEYGVSRVTVRRALAQLVQDGLIERRRGAGTFITFPSMAKPVLIDFSDVLANLVAAGSTTSLRTVECAVANPTPQISEALRLDPGEMVQRACRVRYIDEQPYSYLISHIPARLVDVYAEEELGTSQFVALFERTGEQIEHADQEIGAALAAPDVAKALGLETGSALLAMTRLTYDSRGKGIEHLHVLYSPGRYSIRLALRRAEIGGRRRWVPHVDGQMPEGH